MLKPDGIAFAPHPMLVETDRDKYCVQQIIDFYHRQNTDYADYFAGGLALQASRGARQAGRDAGRRRGASRASAPKYLATVWSTLEGRRRRVGPVAKLQAMWRELPAPAPTSRGSARRGCEQMRDYVVAAAQEARAAVPEPRGRRASAPAASRC